MSQKLLLITHFTTPRPRQMKNDTTVGERVAAPCFGLSSHGAIIDTLDHCDSLAIFIRMLYNLNCVNDTLREQMKALKSKFFLKKYNLILKRNQILTIKRIDVVLQFLPMYKKSLRGCIQTITKIDLIRVDI
jgi:hypothetical protein